MATRTYSRVYNEDAMEAGHGGFMDKDAYSYQFAEKAVVSAPPIGQQPGDACMHAGQCDAMRTPQVQPRLLQLPQPPHAACA
jgi:hypothetical protein